MARPASPLTFHFTPTSASWLNAIEGFFAKLTNRRLKRGVFRSVPELQAAIDRFVDQTREGKVRVDTLDDAHDYSLFDPTTAAYLQNHFTLTCILGTLTLWASSTFALSKQG